VFLAVDGRNNNTVPPADNITFVVPGGCGRSLPGGAQSSGRANKNRVTNRRDDTSTSHDGGEEEELRKPDLVTMGVGRLER
jgi:hypothetical protein